VNGWQKHLVLRRRTPLAATAASPDSVRFTLPRSTVTMRYLDRGVHAALLAVDAGSVPVADLVDTARAALPEADLARLVVELGRLYARGAITLAVEDGDDTVCELSAANVLASLALDLDGPDRRCRLSRFALLRRAGRDVLVESLAAGGRLSLHRPDLAALLATLVEPADEAEVVCRVPTSPPPVLRAVLRVMRAGGLIDRVDRDGLLPEDHERELVMREPHDLFLHNRSRSGLTPESCGGTFRFAGVLPSLPAIRPAWPGPRIPLPRPDLARLVRTDLPLAAAMERRRSRRAFAQRPLTVEELGEFLFRVFRVTAVSRRDPTDPQSYESTLRPVPSAGAAQDLEVYVAAGRVDGVHRGLFHYEPARHALTEVAADNYAVAAILQSARRSSMAPVEPPAVVVLASRFGRLAWKYEGIAYAATLKNAGVAYQAMYLAATAMGLAGCGLGDGDAAAFGLATGAAPHVESPVGEFMIGPAEET